MSEILNIVDAIARDYEMPEDDAELIELKAMAADTIPRATVAAALRELRAKMTGFRNLTAPPTIATVQFQNGAINKCLAELDATIAKLGLEEM